MSPTAPFQHFNSDDIEQLMRLTFVRHVDHFGCLPSTNSQALGMATAPELETPLLVLTDQQTAGRGRGANQWWSAAGALTFSLIMERPEMEDAAGWPRVALTTGIAVCEALHQLCPGLDAALKWPNDVYVQSRKICGILIEAPSHTVPRIVIGVGVNVNNSLSEGPNSIRSSATSLVDVAGYPFSLTSVLTAILNQMSAQFSLLQNAPADLQQQWDTHCLLTDKTVQVEAGSRHTTGICRGIAANGALLVETSTGIEPCLSGAVTRWE